MICSAHAFQHSGIRATGPHLSHGGRSQKRCASPLFQQLGAGQQTRETNTGTRPSWGGDRPRDTTPRKNPRDEEDEDVLDQLNSHSLACANGELIAQPPPHVPQSPPLATPVTALNSMVSTWRLRAPFGGRQKAAVGGINRTCPTPQLGERQARMHRTWWCGRWAGESERPGPRAFPPAPTRARAVRNRSAGQTLVVSPRGGLLAQSTAPPTPAHTHSPSPPSLPVARSRRLSFSFSTVKSTSLTSAPISFPLSLAL